jgi:UDP-glucose:(heptosyl)LPS alpha-1,3-glucosyltransferase
MNLAFIAIRYDLVGGTERDLYELTRQLAQRGHRVTIYCGQVRTQAPSGVDLVRIPSPGFGRIALLWSVAVRGPRLAFAGGHEIVYSFARCVKQDVVRCGGGLHCTYLEDIKALHSPLKRLARSLSLYHRLMLWIERRQYSANNFRQITAISRTVQTEVQAVFQHSDDRFSIIYDGVDLERFKVGADESTGLREKYDIPDNAKVLVFVGKGFERKGLASLLKAMALLPDESVRLMIVGADQDSNTYRVMAQSIGIAGRVHFVGVQKKVEKFYHVADLLVLPSRQEAFGNVVLEAMACGTPAIVSRVSGASEVLTGTLEQGILETHDDENELKTIIAKMLEPELLDTCRVEAASVAQGFSLEKNVREIEAQCEALIQEG